MTLTPLHSSRIFVNTSVGFAEFDDITEDQINECNLDYFERNKTIVVEVIFAIGTVYCEVELLQ